MTNLDGRRALVTGGGTGIGFGCAERLLAAGAHVTIAGRREDVLEEGDALKRLGAPRQGGARRLRRDRRKAGRTSGRRGHRW